MTEATMTHTDDGRFEVKWDVVTMRKDGHYMTGRPETVRAMMGKDAVVVSSGEVVKVYTTREEADFQL